MSQPRTTEPETPEGEYAWRVTKRPGSTSADIEFGSMYADFDGPALTVLMHTLGKALIQIGTMALQSRAEDDDGDDW